MFNSDSQLTDDLKVKETPERGQKPSSDAKQGNAHGIKPKQPSIISKEPSLQILSVGDPARTSSFNISGGQSLGNSTDGSSGRTSSLLLRSQPIHDLLMPEKSIIPSIETKSVLSDLIDEKDKSIRGSKDLLNVLCLRPDFSLRTQLVLAFGSMNAIATIVVVSCCIIVTIAAGKNFENENAQSFRDLVDVSTRATARNLAKTLDARLNLNNAINIIKEAVNDRFEGYPVDSDNHIPFLDMDTNSRIYPINGESMDILKLDWQIEPNVNESNYMEHFQSQERWEYLKPKRASTANGGFLFQGICDPNVTNSSRNTYWPNCSIANNNISSGGVISPSNTAKQIYRKGSDIIPLMKAVFEAHLDLEEIGLYFANSGSGATITFPGYPLLENATYESIGCEWMNAINPYDKEKTIGTQEMIDRCRKEGEVVESRIYNPMERGWCRDQALYPDQLDFSIVQNAFNNSQWVISQGKGIYDRITNEFLACIYLGMTSGPLEKVLKKSSLSENSVVTAVVWDNNGTVIASSNKKYKRYADLGFTDESYSKLYNLVDFTIPWKPIEVKTKYENYVERNGAFISFCYPLPSVPNEYDANYRPKILIIMSASTKDLDTTVAEGSDSVNKTVQTISIISAGVGMTILVLVTLLIFLMARILTTPLNYMNQIASDIVDNFGNPTKNSLIKASDRLTKEGFCTPRTEISNVVIEFNKMVESFSGDFTARTERKIYEEVHNLFSERKAFYDIYKNRDKDNFVYKVEANQDCASKEVKKHFIHKGSNFVFTERVQSSLILKQTSLSTKSTILSPTFLWIVGLIVTPILVFNISIALVVIWQVASEFSQTIVNSKDSFLKIQLEALGKKAGLHSDFLASYVATTIAQLHILTRYSEWLLFDGLKRTKSFSKVTSGIEPCKAEPDPHDCAYFKSNYVCDCKWNERGENCSSYPNGSRHLQVPFFSCQKEGTASISINTTSWWDDAAILSTPYTNYSGSGYNTTYDRLRTISSVPLFQAFYNSDVKKESFSGSFVAFEADGLFVGYKGCDTASHITYSNWSSSLKSAKRRPELCPYRKYGYDPR